jgi:hypothetical protein
MHSGSQAAVPVPASDAARSSSEPQVLHNAARRLTSGPVLRFAVPPCSLPSGPSTPVPLTVDLAVRQSSTSVLFRARILLQTKNHGQREYRVEYNGRADENWAARKMKKQLLPKRKRQTSAPLPEVPLSEVPPPEVPPRMLPLHSRSATGPHAAKKQKQNQIHASCKPDETMPEVTGAMSATPDAERTWQPVFLPSRSCAAEAAGINTPAAARPMEIDVNPTPEVSSVSVSAPIWRINDCTRAGAKLCCPVCGQCTNASKIRSHLRCHNPEMTQTSKHKCSGCGGAFCNAATRALHERSCSKRALKR